MSRIKAAAAVLAGYHLQDYSYDRRWRVNASQNARRDIPYGVRRKMLSWSRELERKDPLFNRYLDLLEQYVVGPTGLQLVSASTDQNFAARANLEWRGWQPYCDIASRFSFGARQGLVVREVAVAGEVFINLLYGNSNRPRIQLLESESIETPLDLAGKEGQVVNGRMVFDGVEMDEYGRPLSYWVKTADDGGKATYQKLPAENVIHIYDPSRVGQVRGLPIIYPVAKDAVDLYELQDLEMLAAKDAANTSKVIKTATGEITAEQLLRGTESTDTSTGQVTYYREAIGAETIILQPGDEYQQIASQRPSVAVQSFWDWVSAREAAGLGVPIEILIMRSLQGTMTRALLQMASSFFRCRTAVHAEAFGRVWEHVVGSTIRQRPGDWRRISYTPPRAIDVDVGYNADATLRSLEAGITTFEEICAANGQDWQAVLQQKAREAAFIRELAKQHGIDPSEISTRQVDRPERISTEPKEPEQATPIK